MVKKAPYQFSENILVNFLSHGKNSPLIAEKEKKEVVEKNLRMVNLWDHKDKLPGQLSGGMKQRVSIAMSLLLNPDILIADEPTTSLDVMVQSQIINLLKKLKKDRLKI